MSAIGREHREILAELTSRHAQSRIVDVACAVELEAYDTPSFHDRLVRAAGGGQFRPWQVVEGLTGLAGFLRSRFDDLDDQHLVELRKVARRRLRVSLLGNLATTVVVHRGRHLVPGPGATGRGTTPAVAGVSIEIGAGEIVALVGENGSGKTTLAKLLCRLYLPQRGRVLWDGVDTATVDPDELRRSVAVIFQDFLFTLQASAYLGPSS